MNSADQEKMGPEKGEGWQYSTDRKGLKRWPSVSPTGMKAQEGPSSTQELGPCRVRGHSMSQGCCQGQAPPCCDGCGGRGPVPRISHPTWSSVSAATCTVPPVGGEGRCGWGLEGSNGASPGWLSGLCALGTSCEGRPSTMGFPHSWLPEVFAIASVPNYPMDNRFWTNENKYLKLKFSFMIQKALPNSTEPQGQ